MSKRKIVIKVSGENVKITGEQMTFDEMCSVLTVMGYASAKSVLKSHNSDYCRYLMELSDAFTKGRTLALEEIGE